MNLIEDPETIIELLSIFFPPPKRKDLHSVLEGFLEHYAGLFFLNIQI